MKVYAVSRCAVTLDTAAHAVRNEVVDQMHAKPQTTLQVGGVEGVKDAGKRLRREANAVIAVIQQQSLCVFFNANIDDSALPPFEAMLERIADQVCENAGPVTGNAVNFQIVSALDLH